jgi:hypothetical protein
MTEAQINAIRNTLAALGKVRRPGAPETPGRRGKFITAEYIARMHGFDKASITRLLNGASYPPGFGYTSARTRNLIILAVSIEADKAGVPFPDDLFVEYFEPSEDDKSIDGLCRSLDHAGTVA